MNQLEIPLELSLRQETTQRLLLDLYEGEDWDGLLAAAGILNAAWHQQSAISNQQVVSEGSSGQSWRGLAG